METYSKFAPTPFDARGLRAGDLEIGEWFVAPVSQTRDSGPLSRSNFRSFLREIGGESDNVQVHRFGHWGPGWYEIIVIRPDSPEIEIAREMADALEDYPIVDESDWSDLEYETACEVWQQFSIADRVDYCQRYGASIFAARRAEIPECRTGEIVSALAGCD